MAKKLHLLSLWQCDQQKAPVSLFQTIGYTDVLASYARNPVILNHTKKGKNSSTKSNKHGKKNIWLK